MKGLKKIALVAAIAAAPFAANAELTALNDTDMGAVTGQAGVTIELETQVNIGEFRYTDEGSFAVTNIALGGAGVTAVGAGAGFGSLLDDFNITIDIAADGDALISLHTISGAPIDWGFTAAQMSLVGATDSTVLVSNMEAFGLLAQLDMSVDTATDHLNIAALFTVENMSFDVDFLGVGIRNMSIKGANSFGATIAPNPADPTAGTFAAVNLDIFKGNGLGASTAVDVLRIDINNIAMDIQIGAIEIGGTSIGSVSLDNLVISNTKVAVYGHN